MTKKNKDLYHPARSSYKLWEIKHLICTKAAQVGALKVLSRFGGGVCKQNELSIPDLQHLADTGGNYLRYMQLAYGIRRGKTIEQIERNSKTPIREDILQEWVVAIVPWTPRDKITAM